MRNLVNVVIRLSDHRLNREVYVYMNIRYFRNVLKYIVGQGISLSTPIKPGLVIKKTIIDKLTSFFFFIFNRHILTQASNEPPKM